MFKKTEEQEGYGEKVTSRAWTQAENLCCFFAKLVPLEFSETTAVMKKSSIALLLLVAALAVAEPQVPGRRKRPNQNQQPTQQQYAEARRPAPVSDACPEDGFFASADQCDKYYECKDGVATERLCPDGLVFIDAGPKVEKCEFPFAVDCTDRPNLQPAHKSMNCPRKHGYFAHEDPTICNQFFFCVDGSFNAITCPEGLVFNDKTGTCTWPDLAKKQHCGSREIYEFDCPPQPAEREAGQMVHPRYAHQTDCQAFWVCIDGKVPRKNGCPMGSVFNEGSGTCDKPKNVPECKDWYKGILDYDEEGEIVTTPKPRPAAVAGTKRKKRPQVPQQ